MMPVRMELRLPVPILRLALMDPARRPCHQRRRHRRRLLLLVEDLSPSPSSFELLLPSSAP